jgi:hypothetical protein
MTSDEEESLLSALREWAFNHPHKDRPFRISMGRSFTPVEYFYEVTDNEEFRSKLFTFLEEQSERSHERPIDMIFRAIEANRL